MEVGRKVPDQLVCGTSNNPTGNYRSDWLTVNLHSRTGEVKMKGLDTEAKDIGCLSQ